MTAQADGYEFERVFAGLLDSKPTKGSGNLWYAKLDVNDGTIVWSLKHTSKESIRLKASDIMEARSAVLSPSGSGLDLMYGMALSIQGVGFVVLPQESFLGITEDNIKIARETKTREKRRRANLPQILRKAMEEEDDG